jgi:hypothetical protein
MSDRLLCMLGREGSCNALVTLPRLNHVRLATFPGFGTFGLVISCLSEQGLPTIPEQRPATSTGDDPMDTTPSTLAGSMASMTLTGTGIGAGNRSFNRPPNIVQNLRAVHTHGGRLAKQFA